MTFLMISATPGSIWSRNAVVTCGENEAVAAAGVPVLGGVVALAPPRTGLPLPARSTRRGLPLCEVAAPTFWTGGAPNVLA